MISSFFLGLLPNLVKKRVRKRFNIYLLLHGFEAFVFDFPT